MKKLILFLGISVISLNVLMAQADKHQLKTNEEMAYYLDPKYPAYTSSDVTSSAWKHWRKAMDKYAMDHPPYPVYVSTGDLSADENVYAESIEAWFMRNRYYPQYIDTGNPTLDMVNWNKSKTEWCKRYPDACSIVEKAQK